MELTEGFGAHIWASDEGTAHRCDGDRNADGKGDPPPHGQSRQAFHKIAEVEEKGKFHSKDRDPGQDLDRSGKNGCMIDRLKEVIIE